MKKKQDVLVPQTTEKWTEEISKLIFEDKAKAELPPRLIDGFRVPKWWECAWRRNPCRLRTCRFCKMMWANEAKFTDAVTSSVGELMRDDELSEEKGRISPHDIVLDNDTTEITDEEWEEFQANEPPEPETFPMYRRLMSWLDPIAKYTFVKEEQKEPWRTTEAYKDLLWYSMLLPSKVYRQLSTKWEVSRNRDDEYEQEFGKLETAYTGYVIRQCVRFTEEVLIELSELHAPFQLVLEHFRRLKPSILAVAPKR